MLFHRVRLWSIIINAHEIITESDKKIFLIDSLLMVCSGSGGEAETLWCLSRVMPSPGFSEAHTLLALDGPAWALTSLPQNYTSRVSSLLLYKRGKFI